VLKLYKPQQAYAIQGKQLNRLANVAKRLYTEQRLNADEMRDLAQIIYEGVLPSVIDLEKEY
jgi:hypothetical protein